MHIPLKDTPIDVRRRIVQHLESLRGTELAEAAELSLGDMAVPIHRPDRDDVAYYEFSLVRGQSQGRTLATCGFAEPTGKKQRKASGEEAAGKSAPQPAGFIIASADRHDFPVAHWSLDRLPPSLQVLRGEGAECGCDDGKAAGRESVPARLYKLDSLAYVAEDQNGAVAGSSGQRPALLAGLPHSLEKYAGRISSSIATPVDRSEDDFKSPPGEHALEREDADVPEIKLIEGETGWDEYKKLYADAFGPLLDALRARAARSWEIEDAVTKLGEGILTGTTHRVGLLGDASVTLRGEGAALVRAELQDNPSGAPSLLIHALPGTVQQETDLAVAIRYASGEHELLRFFIVGRDTPTNGRDDKSGDCDCED